MVRMKLTECVKKEEKGSLETGCKTLVHVGKRVEGKDNVGMVANRENSVATAFIIKIGLFKDSDWSNSEVYVCKKHIEQRS